MDDGELVELYMFFGGVFGVCECFLNTIKLLKKFPCP